MDKVLVISLMFLFDLWCYKLWAFRLAQRLDAMNVIPYQTIDQIKVNNMFHVGPYKYIHMYIHTYYIWYMQSDNEG